MGRAVVDYGMDPRITQRAPYKRTLKDDLRDVPTLSIDPATGLMSGSFLHPNGATIELLGIVDQLDRSGAGYFLGPQTGGALSLERASIIIVDPLVVTVTSPAPQPSP
jgi:hypothetical protein